MRFSATERLLVCVLVVCLVTASGWSMLALDQQVPRPVLQHSELGDFPAAQQVLRPAVEDQLGVTPYRQRVDRLQERESQQETLLQQRLASLQHAETARRQHHTSSVSAGPGGSLTVIVHPALAPELARSRVLRCRQAEQVARQNLHDTRQQLRQAQAEFHRVQPPVQKVYERRVHERDHRLLLMRSAIATVLLWLAWCGWEYARRHEWRYASVALAALVAAALTMVGLAIGYIVTLAGDLATVLISMLGATLAAAALVAVGRSWPDAARQATAPGSTQHGSVDRCPGCATPVSSTQAFCCNCGKGLLTACPHCEAPRPQRVLFCPHCGGRAVTVAKS